MLFYDPLKAQNLSPICNVKRREEASGRRTVTDKLAQNKPFSFK